ncbi:MAG: hypothetical protein WCH34_12085 [Bacteroidota bacterium]
MELERTIEEPTFWDEIPEEKSIFSISIAHRTILRERLLKADSEEAQFSLLSTISDKCTLSILSEAEGDIEKAIVWCEKQVPGFEASFFEAFSQSLPLISNNADIYSEVYRKTRRFIIKKFPYCIYYRIFFRKKQIQILGVVQYKRNNLTIYK